jgi:aspartate kinase
MKVYKFGGASIQNAEGVRNIAKIITETADEDIIIVVSAMGKMTNAFEKVYQSYIKSMPDLYDMLKYVKDFHFNILNNLFIDKSFEVFEIIGNYFIEIENILKNEPVFDKDLVYDKIVSYGEIISSKIVYYYLITRNIDSNWIDIRHALKTDSTFRDAKVDFDTSSKSVENIFTSYGSVRYLTQGFISSDENGNSTTLGREGSDYSAALLAYFLNAESVTIWKDVPGVLTADPRIISDAIQLKEISYHEAIELAYYGAQLIHPKTIKPLQNKNIPLFVKSFIQFNDPGTKIYNLEESIFIPPIYIVKSNQVLISIFPKDFSFIEEENVSLIFSKLAKYRIKTNLMQNSAVSFLVVVDADESKIYYFIGELKTKFSIKYNKELSLITVRHYTDYSITRMTQNHEILLSQLSRRTARFVLK